MEKKDYDILRNIVGDDYFISDSEGIESYLFDQVEKSFRPEANKESVVVKPSNAEELSKIMVYANDNKIPVVVRGGATGLCGGCTPTKESIIISMERFNRILEIDTQNMIAVLEAGVTLMQLLEELDKYNGISFPVHPGDEGAQMGGMAVTNAGGARAVRHGVMRKHITGMEVVLPTGDILQLGGKLVKNNAGYNLAQLIIGSEGTLAIVTKIFLKLYPEETYTASIVAAFEKFENATNAVIGILNSGVSPLAVEYMDKFLWTNSAESLGLKWQADTGEADLLIMLSEKSENDLLDSCKKINEICKKNQSCETLYAEKKQEQLELLQVRGEQYNFKKHMIYDSFDMAVPLSHIAEFIKEIKELSKQYDAPSSFLAHIADGNVHNDMWLVDNKPPVYAKELKMKMYDICFKYGGTITGEHGIGKIRTRDLEHMKSAKELEIYRGIKVVFDPNYILNPGTVIE